MFAYLESPHESGPCRRTHPLDRQWYGPSCVERSVQQMGRPNGVMIAVFGMSTSATGIWW